MTYYYYLASDVELNRESYKEHNLYFEESKERIKGFDFPIQIEIYNGINKKEELKILQEEIQELFEAFQSLLVTDKNEISEEGFIEKKEKYTF